jgi:methylated-DNA-protein-cysteine methyltransferase-like protein
LNYGQREKKQMKNSFTLIYDVVRRIPYGKVATYGQIAALAGNPRWSRVVGYALHVNPDPEHIPCFRVVNRFGQVSSAFAFGGENRQIALLEQEGVTFVDQGVVDLKKHLWNGE